MLCVCWARGKPSAHTDRLSTLLQVWDDDMISDDLIGTATVDLAGVRKAGSTHETAAIKRKSGKQGGTLVLVSAHSLCSFAHCWPAHNPAAH